MPRARESSPEEEQTTRKSGRERKSVSRLQDEALPSKRRQSQAANFDSDSTQADASSESEPESDFEDSKARKAPTRKPRASAVGTSGNGTGNKARAVRKPREPRKSAGGGAGGARKRASATEGQGGADDGHQNEVAQSGGTKTDLKVNSDNSIFNAVRSADSSIQTTVDDWIQSYQDNKEEAIAELVNFILRACGCNASVDEHQASDQDGIVDTLEDIQQQFKTETLFGNYPLVAKNKQKLRSALGSFLTKLYASAANEEILYDDDGALFTILEAWLTSISSSQIRAFRHTSTVVALMSVTALNEVAVATRKEHAQANRAKEAEEKKGRKDKARLKDLDKNCAEIHQRLEALERFLDDLFTDIFINRYRDTEAVIRVECISALGSWMKSNGDYWLDGDYLRYLAWVLSDESPVARREVVKALFALYAREDNIGTMHNFTERFKGLIVAMGTGETDASVRVQAIQVLRQLEHHGLLEDDQRHLIARLVFEKDKRIRNAAADFFGGVVTEEVDRRRTEIEAGRPASVRKGKRSELKQQLEIKVLAELLVKYGNALDGRDNGEEEEHDKEDEEADLVEEHTHKGRIELVVEGLWEELEAVRDWRALIDYLLLDHSSAEADAPAKGKKRPTKGRSSAAEVEAETDGDDADLDQACKLTDEEETVLVEVLVAALDRVTRPARQHQADKADKRSAKQKEEDDEAMSDVSRALIDSIGRLFAKHQVVPTRMVDILAIPRLFNLELYLDMRRISAYEALWDDVTKQFTQHTHPDVIDQAVQTIAHLQDARALSNTNEVKLAELAETATAAMRDILAGQDVESAAFDEDERLAVTAALARVSKAYRWTDLTAALLETDGHRQSSAWEIADAVSLRGRLGYKDETAMVQHAIDILAQHIIWLIANLREPGEDHDDTHLAALQGVVEKRAGLLDRLEEFAIGAAANTTEQVKKTAVINLVELHLFAASATSKQNDPNAQFADLALDCSDELQARCAGFLEAAIQQHVVDLNELDAQAPPARAVEEEDISDAEGGTQRSKKRKQAKKKVSEGPTRAEIRAKVKLDARRAVLERRFEQTVTPVMQAICSGVFDLTHAAVILPHVGRFGPVYEGIAKMVAEELKVEAVASDGAGLVASIVVETLKTAVEAYIDQDDDASPTAGTTITDDYLVHLGRFLVNAIAQRGSGFSFIKALPQASTVELHTEACAALVVKVGGADKEKALAGFRVLAQLLQVPLDAKRALEVKKELERQLGDVGVGEVPGSARAWEPVRAYVKRLTTLMAKDPALKRAADKQFAQGKYASPEQAEANGGADDAGEDDRGGATPKAARINTAAAKKRKANGATRGVDEQAEQEEEEEILPPRKKRVSEVGTPARMPTFKAKDKRSLAEEPASEEEVEEALSTPEDEIEEVDEEEGMDVDEEEEEAVETTQESPGRKGVEREDSVESAGEARPRGKRARK